MSGFLGVPVDAAYHLVSLFASILTPLFGSLAAAAAIVGFTVAVRLVLLPLSYRATRGMAAQARVAPLVQDLRKRYAGQPDMLQREMTALYQAEGTSMFAGCLPLLLQWPAFTVLSLLFRSAQVGGAPNTLLTHRLFGAPLASYWLGGAGPFSAQGAVFAGLFVLLAGLGWLSARMARRAGSPPAVTGAAAGEGVPAALVRLLPFATVSIAVFVPLAAALYLATSTAWTLAERAVFGRSPALRPPTTPAVSRTGPRSLRDTRPPPGGAPQPTGWVRRRLRPAVRPQADLPAPNRPPNHSPE